MTYELLFMAATVALVLIALIALVRVFLGPTVPDRVVGLDTTTTLMVAGMIALGAAYNRAIYVDIAIVFAVLSFVGTLYISKYLEGGFR